MRKFLAFIEQGNANGRLTTPLTADGDAGLRAARLKGAFR
jgi:hypothetical protein